MKNSILRDSVERIEKRCRVRLRQGDRRRFSQLLSAAHAQCAPFRNQAAGLVSDEVVSVGGDRRTLQAIQRRPVPFRSQRRQRWRSLALLTLVPQSLAIFLLLSLSGCSEPPTPTTAKTRAATANGSPTPTSSPTDDQSDATQTITIRIATYNASLHRQKAGQLAQDLSDPSHLQGRQIAEIVQRIRPDILLINEIDYQADGAPPRLLRDNFFAHGQNGQEPIEFPYIFAPPSNTGEPSNMDLDNNGRSTDPQDCFGFGTYGGQYAFAVFSRFPIEDTRSFQKYLWANLPGAVNPQAEGSDTPYYADDVWHKLRLSSKNHCDVAIRLNGDKVLHFLVSHPTPPVFDGKEDRNGVRNSDEIRFWTRYISDPDADITDDEGNQGGLNSNAYFAIAGDLNSDPIDGDSRHAAIQELIGHKRVTDPHPKSEGGKIASQKGKRNAEQTGDPGSDTSSWSSGNYRVDYVLPSSNFKVQGAGVFWPMADESTAELLKASDHRPVWVDVAL